MDGDGKVVITVGSASGERVLRVEPATFRLGAKHSVAPQRVQAGGSGVNSTCRLLAMGIDVFPVLPVAHDSTGRAVVRALDRAAAHGGRSVNYDGFHMEGDGVGTPFTTILTVGAQRTVLNEFPPNIVRQFVRHCSARLELFERTDNAPPSAMVIGHVHADRDIAQGGQGGGITQSLIERFASEGVPVFANFGGSQYLLGTTRWEPYLDRLAYFQLDIDEMRAFCADAGAWSLEEVLTWFRDRCTVAITTERMGAVAQLKGSENVILAWPYELQPEDIVDPTGAGDAFGAGIVASSLSCPLATDEALLHAVETAVLWSAYACTTLGGAVSCPDATELAEFASRYPRLLKTECKPLEEALPMLRLLDRVFPPRA